MSLIDDADSGPPARGSNAPEFSVSELSGAIKRMVEGEFPFVRVRGEVGRVTRASSGHLYFDLKDERAVLSAVTWKGQVAALTSRPEEGMEVVATGRLTTFPGQSRYQMVVEDVAPAGAGALMAQLEARRAKLAAEGLFDAARKRPIPYLPDVIGVVTSPQGAVIRDVLHRLRDRFPRTVVVWPVAVQGAACAPEVARAVQGLNALPAGGAIPRPDVLIVARGGGSIEDLWGFNDERVARAVAASAIPVISAVGHETDWTLIDHAADLRAPTPTAAAEFAVPVRAELLERAGGLGLRGARALRQGVRLRRQRLGDLARALPRADAVTGEARQRLDYLGSHLLSALRGVTARGRVRLADLRPRPGLLRRAVRAERQRLRAAEEALRPALDARARRGREELGDLARRLPPAVGRGVATCGRALGRVAPRLLPLAARAVGEARGDLGRAGGRLSPDLPRAVAARAREAMLALDRQRAALGYEETLRRGFAVVRAGGPKGPVVTTAAEAGRVPLLDVEFADAHLPVRAAAPRRAKEGGPAETEGQGTLL